MGQEVDGGVRQLVLVHGRTKARSMVEPEQRSLVDIAAQVLADDEGKIGITYTGFCLTSLPHKRLADDAIWTKTGHRVRLLVEPGRSLHRDGSVTPIGVPFGSRARMILLYLQTQAVRTNSREVELGRSMREWLGRMGMSWGGETGKTLREQAKRIAHCSLKFYWENEGADGWAKGGFVRSGLRFQIREDDKRQADLWEDRVVLDEVFYDSLRQHPVPLRETALRELSTSSASLDLYIWLAYRLHTLQKPTPVRWSALMHQFGGNYGRPSNFRPNFSKALAAAVVAYPDAKIERNDEGLILHPSRSPVAAKLVALAASKSPI
jgi:hypothetical protein